MSDVNGLLGEIRRLRIESLQMNNPRLVIGTQKRDLLVSAGLIDAAATYSVDGLRLRVDGETGVRVEETPAEQGE